MKLELNEDGNWVVTYRGWTRRFAPRQADFAELKVFAEWADTHSPVGPLPEPSEPLAKVI